MRVKQAMLRTVRWMVNEPPYPRSFGVLPITLIAVIAGVALMGCAETIGSAIGSEAATIAAFSGGGALTLGAAVRDVRSATRGPGGQGLV